MVGYDQTPQRSNTLQLGVRGESFSQGMQAAAAAAAKASKLATSSSSGALPQLISKHGEEGGSTPMPLTPTPSPSHGRHTPSPTLSSRHTPNGSGDSWNTNRSVSRPFIRRRLRAMTAEERPLPALAHLRGAINNAPAQRPAAPVPTIQIPNDDKASGPRRTSEVPKLHPPSFYCPISHQCMHDPVVLTDGHTYERRHIEKWLRTNDTSPVSGAKLTQNFICANHALRNAIEEYFEQVLSGHRQAILQAVGDMKQQENFSSNAALLETIDSLMQCSILVNADLSVEWVLKRITDEAKLLVGAEAASVFLVDRKKRELYSTVNSTGGEIRIPIESGVAGHVACTGVPVIIDDAYLDARFNTAIDTKTGFKTRNILCMPITACKNDILGVAQLINKTDTGAIVPGSSRSGAKCVGPPGFTNNDLKFFQVLAAQAGAAIGTSGMFDSMPSPAHSAASRTPSSTSTDADGPDAEPRPGGTPVHGKEGGPRGRMPPLTPTSRLAGLDGDGADPKLHSGSFMLPYGRSSFRKNKLEPGSAVRAEPSGKCGHSPFRLSTVKPMLRASLDSWQIDALALAELTGDRPLSVLGAYLFEGAGLVRAFGIDRAKLRHFLAEIEKGYPTSNPYHNRAHAASVLHFMHTILSLGGVAEAAAPMAGAAAGQDGDSAQQLVTLAALLAAIVHDYDHDGYSNSFHVKTASERALLYNDMSPNENHHVAASFAVLQRPECNILEALTKAQFVAVRKLVIELVLATDIAENTKILDSFKETLDAASASSGSSSASTAPGSGAYVPDSPAKALLVLKMALKCADLGHVALAWPSHMRWVWRLEAEFFSQGDAEKQLEFREVSMLMDRTKPGVSSSQTGFFEFIALPLFRTFARAYPAAAPMVEAVESNYQTWHQVEADDAASA